MKFISIKKMKKRINVSANVKMGRICAIWLFCIALQAVSIPILAQSAKITLRLKNVTVEEVLTSIENQTEYRFLYNKDIVDVSRIVSITVKNELMTLVLDKLFKGEGVSYTIEKRQIVLNKVSSQQQDNKPTVKVTGKVVDESGETLPGVTVMIEGVTQGTITGIDGIYQLQVPEGATLKFTSIGYTTYTQKITRPMTLNVTMKEDLKQLDEVVVVGYGVQRKSDLTGAVGSVKAKDIQKMPVASVDQALQGRLSGVQITTANGAPGAGSTIRIRGGNSINAGNEPLYVIDGIIGGGDLNTINPSDIASIEVLKDASSTSIYGYRGANGVVLITTKRGDGVEGRQISYNGYYGIQSPVKMLDMLNAPEAADFHNKYVLYNGMDNLPFEDISKVSNTDIQDYIFKKNAPITDHNINLSNSTKNGNYFLSLNYFNQAGTMFNTGLERYQVRFNVDQNIGKYFKMGATLTMSMTNKDNPTLNNMLEILPTAPMYNEDGSYYSINQVTGKTYDNPMAKRDGVLNETRTFRGLGNVYGQLTLFDNLILKSSWGWDISYSKQNQYWSVKLPSRIYNKTGGGATVETQFPITYQNENTLNYFFNLGEHSFNLLGGFTWQKYIYEFLKGSANGFKNDVSKYHALETGDPMVRDIQTGEEQWGLMSYLFRVNYSYKDRYMFTASGRYDGSSRLSDGNKWAFFPSVAVAWRASEEDFIKRFDVFSNLKFRLSYGSSGSQSISPYSVIDRLDSGSTVIGNQEVITFFPGLSANKDLSWEKSNQIDLGIEAGFLDNRINLEFDLYYKRTNDLLLSQEIPYQTGFTSMLRNIGSVENKGFEISLRTLNINTKDFSWSSNISISSNKNKVIDLGGKDFIENGFGSRLIVGEPIGTFYGVKYLGIWHEDEIPVDSKYLPGDPKLEDINDDGIIDINDGQILGNAEPKFYGGFSNDFSYKRLTFSLFFDFSYGNKIYDMQGRSLESGFNGNVYGHNRDAWSTDNPDGKYPRPGSVNYYMYETYAGGGANAQGGCDYYMHDGSYLRLKNLNIQYDVPIKNKLIKSLQVYSSISNVFTLTSYMGYSPDVSSESTSATRRGFDNNAYPQSRSFLLGLKAVF